MALIHLVLMAAEQNQFLKALAIMMVQVQVRLVLERPVLEASTHLDPVRFIQQTPTITKKR